MSIPTVDSQKFHKIGPLKANLIILLILLLALGPFSFRIELGLPLLELGAKKALAVNANVTVFLTGTASTTWTVPADWNNASNTIEVIGGGAESQKPRKSGLVASPNTVRSAR